MGSSGRDTFTDYDWKQLLEKVQKTEEITKDAGFETNVNAYINELQAQFNSRDRAAIKAHLDEIKAVLSEDIEDTITLLFGGSVAKHTFVDGLSDVDALVLLSGSELKKLSPNKVRELFFNKLKSRFTDLVVKQGKLAVTIEFPKIEIQLLPAVRHANGYQISDISGEKWSVIKPRKFSAQLTAVNQNNGNKVVPTIKLIKAINSTLPPNRQMLGYHIESLAVKIFKGYKETQTPKAMLTHFYSEASKLIMKPLADVTQQSLHVDEYLGKANSISRRVIADELNLFSRRMQNADNARSIDMWKTILNPD